MHWIQAFENQFVPAREGYVFYSGKRSGGKSVTVAEHARLTQDWRRHAGLGRMFAIVLICSLVIMLSVFAAVAELIPSWGIWVAAAAIFVVLLGPMLWAGYAPHRLVKDRAPVAPPRDPAEVMRQHRASMSWGFLAYFVAFGAWNLANPFFSKLGGTLFWLSTASGVLMLIAVAWIATRKLLDGRE